MFLDIRSWNSETKLNGKDNRIEESKGAAYLIPLKWRQSTKQPHRNDVCCRAGHENEGVDSEEQRVKHFQLAHLLPGQRGLWLPRESLLELEAGIMQ